MARAHAVAAVVEDASGQQRFRFHPGRLVTVILLVQFGLDGIEQRTIDNGRLLAFQNVAFEEHLDNVKSVAEQVNEWSSGEWNASDGLSRFQCADFGDDVPLAQISHQQIEAACFEVAPEYGSYP